MGATSGAAVPAQSTRAGATDAGPRADAALPARATGAIDASVARSAERYRMLLEVAALDVFRTDARGQLVTDMPGWRELTGSAQPVIGLGWLDDVHPRDRDRVRADWLDGSVATGRAFDCKYRVLAADGGSRVIRTRAVPVHDHPGEPSPVDAPIVEWIGVSEDRTAAHLVVQRDVALHTVTAALGRAVTIEQALSCVVDVGRATSAADGAFVTMVDESGTILRLATVQGYPGVHAAALKDSYAELSVYAARLPAHVVRTGEPAFIEDTADLKERLIVLSPAVQAATAADRAWAILPLIASGKALGSLGFAWRRPQHFDADHRRFLLSLASQTAQAIERASVFEAERTVSQTLQAALLPTGLPSVPGFAMAARYTCAHGSEVGGDWYDVIWVNDREVALVLGDVMGRGVRAAAGMGVIRNVLRGAALVDPEPVTVLTALDRLFASSFPPEEIATCVYLLLDTETGYLRVANAGHLPPLLVRKDGSCYTLDDGAGPVLGVPDVVRTACRGTTLAPEDLLLLCSDGLVERRGRDLGTGIAELEQLAVQVSRQVAVQGSLECAVESLLTSMLGAQGSDDDVSVLLARRLPSPAFPS